MYKRIVFLLFLCATFVQGQETKVFYIDYPFESGAEVYVFGDHVKLRSAPTTDADVLHLLRIGEPVIISKKEEATKIYRGIESSWYEVTYKGKTGYILGGLLSLDKIKIKGDTFLFSMSSKDEADYLNTRLLQEDLSYKEATTRLNNTTFSIRAYNNKGLEGVHTMILVDYFSEACGEEGGGTYIFNTGSDIVKAFDYSSIGDAGVFSYGEIYTFPNDPGGVKGQILYNSITESVIDDESDSEEMEVTKESKVFVWKNNKLAPQN